ncbi:hypothetical protein SAY86_012937 [Trapa natans]|uniref:Subtilisin-like protease SBT1.2 n=1 Tax=Trapa natans TaxID=22666 RepID=A0AAN7REA8_TRANT|nr:hypothetical protein SAY86_012937 [Trapa natans]
MEQRSIFLIALVTLSLFCLALLSQAEAEAETDTTLRTYIVQLHPNSPTTTSLTVSNLLHQWHLSFVRSSMSSPNDGITDDPSSRILYSYRSAMEGFAALLSETEATGMRNLPGVVAVRPDRRLELHTTYSYKFLGLSSSSASGPWAQSRFGNGAIIGVLDTGVWPESPSFDDRGMPPLPKKWRGICQQGQDFNSTYCNRKLIGARFFTKGHLAALARTSPDEVQLEYVSPRDSQGHGTHTSSTAGGAPVAAASVLGNGAGVARGMAPGSHLAIYKVCWLTGCYSSDILAAMDVAIRDGVDVLSLSLGGFPVPLYDDSIAIGSFRAMERGISVVCSAGNNGPMANSVANEAPWIVTVGASTLDRRFPAMVRMGNGKSLYGESMYPGNRLPNSGQELEVVYVTGGDKGSEYCFRGSLPMDIVRGKMVVCDRGVNGRAEKGEVVKEAGGAAMILANTEINGEEDSVDVHVLPATQVGAAEAYRLKAYINSTAKATARIVFGGTVIGANRAPVVARFSSRGPSITDPGVLKPDVVAPGVNIIAAWPGNRGPNGLPEDSRKVNFTVLSGTSMACPHVSGIAALVRAAHPRWSPAAVKSAIMTTADSTDHMGEPIMDDEGRPAGVFDMGAGHVNPLRAMDPGLVYNISPNDYVTHLCTLGYRSSNIFTVSHRNVSCREVLRRSRGFSLNYPSISATFRGRATKKIIRRKVTNVGEAKSVYTVKVAEPEGVRVRVRPRQLAFERIGQTLSYKVWLISRRVGLRPSEGHLRWINAKYQVRSPISVNWNQS